MWLSCHGQTTPIASGQALQVGTKEKKKHRQTWGFGCATLLSLSMQNETTTHMDPTPDGVPWPVPLWKGHTYCHRPHMVLHSMTPRCKDTLPSFIHNISNKNLVWDVSPTICIWQACGSSKISHYFGLVPWCMSSLSQLEFSEYTRPRLKITCTECLSELIPRQN